MKTLDRIGRLIQPSFYSLAVEGILVLVIALGSSWSYIVRNDIISRYTSGLFDASSSILDANGTITTLRTTVFSNPLVNKVLFVMFWAILGLLAYIVFTLFQEGVKEAIDTSKSTHYIHAKPHEIKRAYSIKVAVRILIALLWLVYCEIFFGLLVPFSVLCLKVWGGEVVSAPAWAYAVLGVGTLAVSLHLHVIFARLFFFRLRLFGSEEELA